MTPRKTSSCNVVVENELLHTAADELPLTADSTFTFAITRLLLLLMEDDALVLSNANVRGEKNRMVPWFSTTNRD